MECLQKALAAFEDIGQIVWQGKCLSHISATYWRLGMFGNALTSAQRALDIVREVGDEREEGAALLQLAQASLGLEQTDAAVRYSSRAAELSRSHGDRGEEASALATLGTALDREGRSAEARQNLREAYLIFADLADARADEILGLLA
jgi:tetratricopeptide (TPR) repeat protein